MASLTVTFEPYATADARSVVQRRVDQHNLAITGPAEWWPAAFVLRVESGAVLRGLLGDLGTGWLHARTLRGTRLGAHP